jgi:hypothetical protein
MYVSRASIIVRGGLVLGVLLVIAGAAWLKSGAFLGTRDAILRARAAMLCRDARCRSAEAFPELAAGGTQVATVTDAAGSAVWRSPDAGGVSLPDGSEKIVLAHLENGRSMWVVSESAGGLTASIGEDRSVALPQLARFVGVPLCLIFLPTLVLSVLYPGPKSR